MKTEKEVDAFMRALYRLSKEHGIALDSCGCCDSIKLKEIDPKDTTRAYVAYLNERNGNDPIRKYYAIAWGQVSSHCPKTWV